LNRLLRYLQGTVEVTLEGGLFNRFFSLAMNERLHVRNIRLKGNTARFYVFAREYARMRPIARKSQCRMRVSSKSGLPFAVSAVPNKMSLIAGLLIFCLVIGFLGSMIFTIEIAGSSTIPRKTLLDSLARNGLRVGMMRSDVNAEAVRHAVMIENDRLAWMAINLSFGKALVEVRDKITQQYQDALTGRAVVAKCDAQVKEISIINGYPVVRPGEVVLKGQTLVSNTDPEKGVWYADKVEAAVYGYTEYTMVYELPKYHVFRVETGNVTRHRTVLFADREVDLFRQEYPYRYFNEIEYVRQVRVFSVDIPLTVRTVEYREVEQYSGLLNRAQADGLFRDYQAGYERASLAACEILNREMTVTESPDSFEYRVKYLCYESIGVYI